MKVNDIDFPSLKAGDLKQGDLIEDNTNHDTWMVTYVCGPAFNEQMPPINDEGILGVMLPDGAIELQKISTKKENENDSEETN